MMTTESAESAGSAEAAGADGCADPALLQELTGQVFALASRIARGSGFAELTAPDDLASTGATSADAEGVRAAGDGAAGTVDAALISYIGALETLKSVACAGQACATAAFADAQRAGQAQAGIAASRVGRGIASQVGLARRESPNKGQILLGVAQSLTQELPCTLAALARGEINEWRAILVVRETAILSREDRAAVDRELCGPGGTAASLGDAAIGRAARAIGQRLDPGAAWARAQKAEQGRRVTIRPAPDCMVTLTALLPVVQGVGVHAALSQAADAAIAAGRQGTAGRGALMADELIARVLATATRSRTSGRSGRSSRSGGSVRPAGSGSSVRPAASSGSGGSGGSDSSGGLGAGRVVPEPAVEIQLIMTDQTLLGLDDQPAHLTGYGPIPAPLARRIATGDQAGDQADDQAVRWIRRLYQKPGAGLIAMDSQRRLFPAGIRRFIIARDQFCRTPWCDALIRHIDHIADAAAGGPTSATNAQGLCEACNYAKEAQGWQQTSSDDAAEVITTTPAGHRYVSRPPQSPGASPSDAIRPADVSRPGSGAVA